MKVTIPLRGAEADEEGAPLHKPETNQVFVAELKRLSKPQVEVLRWTPESTNQSPPKQRWHPWPK